MSTHQINPIQRQSSCLEYGLLDDQKLTISWRFSNWQLETLLPELLKYKELAYCWKLHSLCVLYSHFGLQVRGDSEKVWELDTDGKLKGELTISSAFPSKRVILISKASFNEDSQPLRNKNFILLSSQVKLNSKMSLAVRMNIGVSSKVV